MSKRSKTRTTLLAILILASTLINGNGDLPFQGNRRPGILGAPSDLPTGENAHLYLRMGALPPNEFLDLLSEDPK